MKIRKLGLVGGVSLLLVGGSLTAEAQNNRRRRSAAEPTARAATTSGDHTRHRTPIVAPMTAANLRPATAATELTASSPLALFWQLADHNLRSWTTAMHEVQQAWTPPPARHQPLRSLPGPEQLATEALLHGAELWKTSVEALYGADAYNAWHRFTSRFYPLTLGM